MKQAITLGAFVVLGACIIAGGAWYDHHISEESQQAITADATVAAQAQEAQLQTEQKNMEKLTIKDSVVGTGAEAKNGDTVTVNYVGTLDNGTKFDSSYDRHQPFSFLLGAGQVIQGWDLGVLGMKVGGKRELVIPSELGYGAQGAGSIIPPNATLHFTVELLSVASSSGK